MTLHTTRVVEAATAMIPSDRAGGPYVLAGHSIGGVHVHGVHNGHQRGVVHNW